MTTQFWIGVAVLPAAALILAILAIVVNVTYRLADQWWANGKPRSYTDPAERARWAAMIASTSKVTRLCLPGARVLVIRQQAVPPGFQQTVTAVLNALNSTQLGRVSESGEETVYPESPHASGGR